MAADLVEDHLFGLAAALRARTRVGDRVLRGGVANAVANTLLHLSWVDPVRDRYVSDARAFLAHVPGLAELVNIESVRSLGEA